MGGMHPRFDGYMTVNLAHAYLELEAENTRLRDALIKELEAENTLLRDALKRAGDHFHGLDRDPAHMGSWFGEHPDGLLPTCEHYICVETLAALE